MEALYVFVLIVLFTGLGAILILSFRKPMSMKKFDLLYANWYKQMGLNEETEENIFIKNELYNQYVLVFQMMGKFDISSTFKELHKDRYFIDCLETLKENLE